jgi:sodium transport system ATP-binding protein
MLGIESIPDQRSAGFSQGERMKTALGRSLVHGLGNMVLDEPTSGLDVPPYALSAIHSGEFAIAARVFCSPVIVASGRQVAHGTAEEIRQGDGESFEDAYVRLTC